jgi:hypothetical protein
MTRKVAYWVSTGVLAALSSSCHELAYVHISIDIRQY